MASRPLMTALFALAAGAAFAGDGVVDRISATVNGEPITLSEVYELGGDFIRGNCQGSAEPDCWDEEEGKVLEALIRRQLMAQELEELGMAVSSNEVEQAIDSVVQQYGMGDRDALKREVERSGLAWATYRRQIAEQLRQQRFQEAVLRSRVSIKDDELQDYYLRATRDLAHPMLTTISAFGYQLPAGADGDTLATEVASFRERFQAVREGKASWDALVAEYDTAGMGALLSGQPFAAGDLNDALDAVVQQTPVDVIAEPVIVGDILYGVKVVRREEGEAEVPPFEEIKGQLGQQLMQEKMMKAEDEWFEMAKREAAIKIFLSDGSTSTAL